jgi:hypothetical protein
LTWLGCTQGQVFVQGQLAHTPVAPRPEAGPRPVHNTLRSSASAAPAAVVPPLAIPAFGSPAIASPLLPCSTAPLLTPRASAAAESVRSWISQLTDAAASPRTPGVHARRVHYTYAPPLAATDARTPSSPTFNNAANDSMNHGSARRLVQPVLASSKPSKYVSTILAKVESGETGGGLEELVDELALNMMQEFEGADLLDEV